jgi:cytidylate kinase
VNDAPVTVAIDGPAGSGKSSVARAAAARLGYGYLDTGAAYRAVAWFGLRIGADLPDPEVSAGLVGAADVELATDPADRTVRAAGQDVTAAIREPAVSAATTFIARNPAARAALNDRFRALITAADPGIVVEGRDITTVVAPDAAVRILLTAAPEVRAQRRTRELTAAGAAADPAQVLAAIAQRDAKDSEMVEFLSAAPGVTTVDSTALTFDATVDAVVALAQEAGR